MSTLTTKNICQIVSTGLEKMSPEEAATMLVGGILAGIVCNISDEHWSAMQATATQPCGLPECDCEKLKTGAFAALDMLRDEIRTQRMEVPE